mgnify:CR=1 FL=1
MNDFDISSLYNGIAAGFYKFSTQIKGHDFTTYNCMDQLDIYYGDTYYFLSLYDDTVWLLKDIDKEIILVNTKTGSIY